MRNILITLLLSTIFSAFETFCFGQKLGTPTPTFSANGHINFYDVQKAFYDNHKEDTSSEATENDEKDGDYEKFKRWEWYWKQRVGKNGQFPPNNILYSESEKYNRENPKGYAKTTSTTASWNFMGTSSSTGGYHGIGRVACIAFHPIIANTFWVGTPAGGLWKTTDGGSTWSTNTDLFPTLGISDIAINPVNPNTMYVATGDGDMGGGSGDTKSQGVFKSTNGGSSWSFTGLYWTDSFQVLIRRIVMDPTDTSVLLAATSWGIYRTTNGGTTWTGVAGGKFTDLQFNPTNHNIIYATTYNLSGTAQICRSTDNGVTWYYVTSFSGITRIKLAVTPAWPSLVYALTVNTSLAGPYGCEGLYWSVDNGATFHQQWAGSCGFNLLGYNVNASGCNGQGNYDLAFAMDPTNAGKFFVGGINTWKTIDTGQLWNLKTFWHDTIPAPAATVHADKHWLAYHPLVSGTLFECNDGGLYKTIDGGVTWTDLTNGMGISEIYRIGTSATVTNNIICGLQDNGSKELKTGLWYDRTGGDGTECIIDYTNSNIQYASGVYGVIYKTVNNWVSQTMIVNSSLAGTGTVHEVGDWVTPYIMNPINHNTLLVGKSQVYKTTNAGSSWNPLATSISGTGGANIVAIAYAPSDSLTIYVAYPFKLYKTTNGGLSWTLIRMSTDALTYIAVDPTNSLHLWVTNSGYTPSSKIFYSSDGGSTWVNWSGTLPNVPVNCIVYQNYGCPGIYVGTDIGVYYYGWGYGLTGWIPFNTGLPNVVVSELEISYNNNKLWAATFGRGLWSTDLYTGNPITGITSVCVGASTTLYNATAGGTWSSSNTAIATVGSLTGTVTGITAGTATITYTLSTGCPITTVITVNPLPAPITGTLTVCEGLTTSLFDATVGGTWSSSNTLVATISAGGVVTGIAAGTAIITYNKLGCINTTTVTVNPLPAIITGIFHVCQGLMTALNDATTGGTWSSSNISIATVSGGNVTGVAAGGVTITYTLLTGCKRTAAFTVNPLPSAISGTTSVCEGLTTNLNDATVGGTWSSSDASVATIDAGGTVTGVAAGIATITYTTSFGCIVTTLVTVTPPCSSLVIATNSDKVEIYPNPVSNKLTIQINAGTYNSFTITDDIGQTVIKDQIVSKKTIVNIKELISGVYTIYLSGSNGMVVKKFVKM